MPKNSLRDIRQVSPDPSALKEWTVSPIIRGSIRQSSHTALPSLKQPRAFNPGIAKKWRGNE